MTLDTWHWHLSGGTLESLRSVPADKIISVTLADAEFDTTAATATLEARKLPGEEGAIDVAALLTAIAELGYDGPVTPAPDRSQFPAQGREAIVKKLGASLDRVWKSAGLTAGGKLAAVARHADMDSKNLWEKLTKYGLRRPAHAEDPAAENGAA